jgi:flagellar assembly factor FliW
MGKGNTLNTVHLGKVEIETDSVLTLPGGLPGFERCTRFVILTFEQYIPFQWLQSVEDPNLSLPIIRPEFFCPDYRPAISGEELRSIDLLSLEDAEVYTITTIGANPQDVTANLRAPLVINRKARLGKQCIIERNSHSFRHPVLVGETC